MTRELSFDVEESFLPSDNPDVFAGASLMFSRPYSEGRFPELNLRVFPIDQRNPLYKKKGYQWFAELNEAGRTCLANAVFRGNPKSAKKIYKTARDKLIEVLGIKEPILKDFFGSVN